MNKYCATHIILHCAAIKRAIDDNDPPLTIKAIVDDIEKLARRIETITLTENP